MATSGSVPVERKSSLSGEVTVAVAVSGGTGSVSIGGYPPLVEKGGPSARIARSPLRHSGDVNHKANCYATRVVCSS
jgi:hypothetical protein